jgi:hypothetical protein
MVHKQCRICGFWITTRDKHCPDCAIIKPYIDQEPIEDQLGVAKDNLYTTRIVLSRQLKVTEGIKATEGILACALAGIFILSWTAVSWILKNEGTVIGGVIGSVAGGLISLSYVVVIALFRRPREGNIASEYFGSLFSGWVFGWIIGMIIGTLISGFRATAHAFVMFIGFGLILWIGERIGRLLRPLIRWIGRQLRSLIGRTLGRIATVQQRRLSRLSPQSLRQAQETIEHRLKGFADSEERLREVKHRIEQEAAKEQWQTVRATLEMAIATVQRQRDRYLVKLWEISLVRWQNKLEPIADDWDKLTYEECDRRLHSLASMQKSGVPMLWGWEKTDLASIPDGKRCITRIREGLEVCHQLRRALLAKQAALAVKNIAPLDEVLDPIAIPAALGRLELLNARAAIGEFSSAFRDLEAEHERLQIEDDVSRELQQVLRPY